MLKKLRAHSDPRNESLAETTMESNIPTWLQESGGKLRHYIRQNGKSFHSKEFSHFELQQFNSLEFMYPQYLIERSKTHNDFCFESSIFLAQNHELRYVEGYVYHPTVRKGKNKIIHHAWVSYRGKVVDFLRAKDGGDIGKRSLCVMGDFTGMEYFGIEFMPETLKSALSMLDGRRGTPLMSLADLAEPLRPGTMGMIDLVNTFLNQSPGRRV